MSVSAMMPPISTPICAPSSLSSSSSSSAEDQRDLLLQRMLGKRIRLPDIHCIMGDEWPFSINADVQRLRVEATCSLEQLSSSRRLSRLKAADAGFFAACWWPYASPERLRVATWLSIWLFAWDDEMDSLEFSKISKDLELAHVFREDTRCFLNSVLGLSATPYDKLTPHPINALFLPAAEGLRKEYSLDKRKGLMKELDLFIDMTAQEQVVSLNAELPTRQEYMTRRMGSSAVGVCLAISEYCLELDLPDNVIGHETLRTLWQQTNIIISVVNDILSIPKELKQGQVDSLVPVLFVETEDLQTAIDEAAVMIDNAVTTFNTAAKSLRHIGANSEQQVVDNDDDNNYSPANAVEGFIQSCQYACSANLYWSLSSGRYGLGCDSLHGGREITL